MLPHVNWWLFQWASIFTKMLINFFDFVPSETLEFSPSYSLQLFGIIIQHTSRRHVQLFNCSEHFIRRIKLFWAAIHLLKNFVSIKKHHQTVKIINIIICLKASYSSMNTNWLIINYRPKWLAHKINRMYRTHSNKSNRETIYNS